VAKIDSDRYREKGRCRHTINLANEAKCISSPYWWCRVDSIVGPIIEPGLSLCGQYFFAKNLNPILSATTNDCPPLLRVRIRESQKCCTFVLFKSLNTVSEVSKCDITPYAIFNGAE
jgi:hypothetical protein